jgi:hypothetical protein
MVWAQFASTMFPYCSPPRVHWELGPQPRRSPVRGLGPMSGWFTIRQVEYRRRRRTCKRHDLKQIDWLDTTEVGDLCAPWRRGIPAGRRAVHPRSWPGELPAQPQRKLQSARRLAAVSGAQYAVARDAAGVPRVVERVEEIRVEADGEPFANRNRLEQRSVQSPLTLIQDGFDVQIAERKAPL